MLAGMSDLLTPGDVERMAQASGKSVSEICRIAEIAPSTFSRWKAGKTEPTLSVYRRIVAALDTAAPPNSVSSNVSARDTADA